MKARTWMIWAAIALLTVLPLWLVSAPPAEPGGEAPSIFGGADERAQQAIGAIAPDYKPWFSPVVEPASGEIASLLFALQAALGAGVIGFWLGMSVTRERARRAAAQNRPSDAMPDAERAPPAPAQNNAAGAMPLASSPESRAD